MSFLLEGDSSVAPSVTPESTTTSQAWKKGKKSSPIWAHTRLPIEGEDLDLLYCSYCEQGETAERAPYGSNSSLAMTKCYGPELYQLEGSKRFRILLAHLTV